MGLILFALGIVIRLLLIPVPGFKADIAFWKGWGLAASDNGILWLAKNTNYNYPPGFAYILYAINKIYALFKNPYDIQTYWLDTNALYLFLVKAITIASDIGIVLLILVIAKKLKSKLGPFFALLYFLNPVAIFDGVIWGQVDQFGVFLFLASLYLLLQKRLGWASIIFTLSFLMKFQNLIFIPLFFLFIYKEYSFEGLMKCLQYSLAVFLFVSFPFWFHRETEALIHLFTVNTDWFPWYSLNAFNLWWIVSGLNGMNISDKTLFVGILNAKQAGFMLFSFAYAIATLGVFFSKKDALWKRFMIGCTLVIFTFFHLLTQSHERYLYHLLVLLPIVIVLEKPAHIKRGLIFFLLISAGIFLNMYLSIGMNYPDQVIWIFNKIIVSRLSLIISLYQIGLFIYFIRTYVISTLRLPLRFIIGLALIVIFFVAVKNMNYLLQKPISLTNLSPISSRQDYLVPVYNKTVESVRGVFYWNRLSSNYFFYEKGIGSHADSEIVYHLGRRFSRFRTDFSIDTEASTQAKAFFILEGDNRVLYTSKSKGRFDLPGTADIDVKNVTNLTLKIVKDGESNYGAHADWLNPYLIR